MSEKQNKILLIDERAIVRETLAFALTQHNYAVCPVADPEEAIQSAGQFAPDLIVLDVCLSKMSPDHMLQKIRGIGGCERIPIVVLTDESEKEVILRLARFKLKAWLLKRSFILKQFIERIDCILADQPATEVPHSAEAEQSKQSKQSEQPEQPEQVATRQATVSVNNVGVDDIKDLKPIIKRSEVHQILDSCHDLNGLSPTVAQILRMTRQKNCSIEMISKIVKQDQAISLKLLKLANSAIYARGETVDTVRKAIMRIGLNKINQTVMSISVIDNFAKSDSASTINLMDFWEHSIATGLISNHITRELGYSEDDIDNAFTIGLLHDIGRLVYAELFSDIYPQVLDHAQRLQAPLELVESRLMLINHAEAVDRILHSWNFPNNIINPIAFHQLSVGNIRRMAPRSLQEIAILALSNRIAHALLLGSSGNCTMYPIDEYLSTLNLDPKYIAKLCETIPDEVVDIKIAMLSNTNNTINTDYYSAYREQFPDHFNPIVVSGNPDAEPVNLMVRRMTEFTDGDLPPSIAFVVINNNSERVKLGMKLVEMENNAGVEPLPLIIISRNGKLVLEDSLMAKRKTALTSFPFRLDVFAELIKQFHLEPVTT